MRQLVLMAAAGLVVAMAVPHGQAKPAGTPADTFDQTLIANERALQAAVANKDKAAFVSLVLPDGAWTTRQGFVEMRALADGLPGFEVTKFEVVNPHVIRLTDDSALVIYVWSGTSTLNSQPLSATTLASTAWAKRDGQWRAVHHQQTELVKQ